MKMNENAITNGKVINKQEILHSLPDLLQLQFNN